MNYSNALINKLNKDNFPSVYNFYFISLFFLSRTAFTSEYGADTITPIPDSSVPIGQRDDMSDIDILRINRLYECSEYRNEMSS